MFFDLLCRSVDISSINSPTMKTSGIVLIFAALTGAVSAKKKLDAWFYSGRSACQMSE
jgi:hypothetical protein